MADYNSSLPVRTENDGDVVIRVGDATLPSQQLKVNSDGSVNITDNSGSITVDATDLDIRNLSSAQDSVEVLQATHDNLNLNANIQVGDTDVSNANPVPISDGNSSITIDNADLTEMNGKIASNYGASTGAVRVASQIGNASGAADFGNGVISAQTLRTASVVTDGSDVLAINTDGSINVVITDSTPGTQVNDYNTESAIAAGASSTHTYTSTGNFYLTQVEASASGKMKIEIQVDGTTVFVKFNSSAAPNLSLELSQPILVTSGDTVTIIRTNRDAQPMDFYSTISGYIA